MLSRASATSPLLAQIVLVVTSIRQPISTVAQVCSCCLLPRAVAAIRPSQLRLFTANLYTAVCAGCPQDFTSVVEYNGGTMRLPPSHGGATACFQCAVGRYYQQPQYEQSGDCTGACCSDGSARFVQAVLLDSRILGAVSRHKGWEVAMSREGNEFMAHLAFGCMPC